MSEILVEIVTRVEEEKSQIMKSYIVIITYFCNCEMLSDWALFLWSFGQSECSKCKDSIWAFIC